MTNADILKLKVGERVADSKGRTGTVAYIDYMGGLSVSVRLDSLAGGFDKNMELWRKA